MLQQSSIKEMFQPPDNSVAELVQLIESSGEEQINAVPFKDSWTAAMVAEHVTKSTRSITQALNMPGGLIDRDPGERIPELKAMFLNFNTKMKSPAFILPSQDTYDKQMLMGDLTKSFERLKEESYRVNLSEAINHPAFGDITKLELLYFVKYHTERHIHQIKNILKIVRNNNRTNEPGISAGI